MVSWLVRKACLQDSVHDLHLIIRYGAAVCGNVFASPNPSQVRRAIELVGNDKG